MSTFPGMFPAGLRARRAVVAAPDDEDATDGRATAAMIDALEALSLNDPKKAAAILAAAIRGEYQSEGGTSVPPVQDMEAEGIPQALAAEIDEQKGANPALARSSLAHARARLGTTKNAFLPPVGARARVGNPWLPFGGREGAA